MGTAEDTQSVGTLMGSNGNGEMPRTMSNGNSRFTDMKNRVRQLCRDARDQAHVFVVQHADNIGSNGVLGVVEQLAYEGVMRLVGAA